MSTPHIDTLAILGCGHIGSSVAAACRARGLVGTVVGYDADPTHAERARALGTVDKVAGTPAAAATDADVVLLAAPVGALAELAAAAAPALKRGAIVTDTGSTKRNVLEAVAPAIPPGVHWIPGHPVAGIEKSGPDAALADLFEDRWWILTPPPGADAHAVERLIGLWRALGSRVSVMDAGHHDKVLAITSHLPHLIAYTIVGTAKDLEDVTQSEVITYSAGGFRDFTRIAASSPVMWRDVFLNNKDAVFEMLATFKTDLATLEEAMAAGDGDALEAFFTRTRDIRRRIIDARQASTPDYEE